jgi:hypothetical protein
MYTHSVQVSTSEEKEKRNLKNVKREGMPRFDINQISMKQVKWLIILLCFIKKGE